MDKLNVVPMPAPLLVDIKAAAHMLSSSVWAVRELLWGGELPFVRIGKKHLISVTDLQKFVEKLRKQAA